VHVEDLADLIQALDAAPPTSSDIPGGGMCLVLALRKPHLVRSIVLAEPPVPPLLVSTPPGPIEMVKLMVTQPRRAVAFMKFGAKGVGPR